MILINRKLDHLGSGRNCSRRNPHLTLPKKVACLLDDRKPADITAFLDKRINIARHHPSVEKHPLFIAGITNSRQSVTGRPVCKGSWSYKHFAKPTERADSSSGNKISGGVTRGRAGYLLKTPLAISGPSTARRGSGSTALAGRRPSRMRQG